MESNVGLFENQRDANRRSCIDMIERSLAELGHAPAESRTGNGAWRIKQGSAAIYIALIDRDDFLHLRLIAPVMLTDARVDSGKLFAKLLRLNATELYGAAFAVVQNEVQLVSERSTIDLDYGEVRDMLARLRKYADEWDDKLVDEFGGHIGGLDREL